VPSVRLGPVDCFGEIALAGNHVQGRASTRSLTSRSKMSGPLTGGLVYALGASPLPASQDFFPARLSRSALGMRPQIQPHAPLGVSPTALNGPLSRGFSGVLSARGTPIGKAAKEPRLVSCRYHTMIVVGDTAAGAAFTIGLSGTPSGRKSAGTSVRSRSGRTTLLAPRLGSPRCAPPRQPGSLVARVTLAPRAGRPASRRRSRPQ